MKIEVQPIGYVETRRSEPIDDLWGEETSRIVLCSPFDAQSLQGLSEFSHVEVLYHFHQVELRRIETGARHPRNNLSWPAVGIFSQRGKNRPNRLGSTVCLLQRVSGTTIHVVGLDAIDGTPVLDLKPVMAEFLPRGQVHQPRWSHELMRRYWKSDDPEAP
jgi:tRNA-Thr(GGU) m(6)t(6)A37 methyltransferase TsaA